MSAGADREPFDELAAGALAAFAAVAQIHRETGETDGRIKCPICNGEIRWRIDPNGHSRGACEREDCVAWIQ